jgi:S1-C subfamily serine protease
MKRRYAATCVTSALLGFIAASLARPAWGPRPSLAQEQLAPIQRRFPAVQTDAFRNPKIIDDPEVAAGADPRDAAGSADSPGDGVPRQARLPARAGFTPIDDASWEDFTPEERTNIGVYEKANRSVVNISTRTMRPDYFMMVSVDTDGTGSGSVLDTRGHILTNLHVVEGAREIRVTLDNGEDFEAGLVGQDPVNDIAVLRIAAPTEMLHPVQFGTSQSLRVGQKVFAIGNPFGLDRTLTVGIISSLNRSIPSHNGRTMKSIIQIDAALNRGNSGGPLLNSRGLLIGMNTAIASNTGENTGVGFAIPAGTIQRVVPQLIEKGRVIRPTAGIVHTHPTEAGLVVAALLPGGPAEQAGLRGFRVLRQQRQRGAFLYERTVVDR